MIDDSDVDGDIMNKQGECLPLLHNDSASQRSMDTTEPISVDDVLEQSCDGLYGKFQLLLQVAILYIALSIDYQLVLAYFIGDDPAWKCVPVHANIESQNHTNTSDFCTLNPHRTVHPDNVDFNERCKLARDRWNYVTPLSYSYVTEFDLTCDRKHLAALCSAAIYIGGVFGVFTGPLMDKFGRKIVIWVSMCLSICTSVGCYFVTDICQLIILRIVLGCFVFTVYNGIMVWLLEFIPTRSRPLSMCMLTCAFALSSLLMDAVAYVERDWRELNLYMCMPAIAAAIVFVPMPRSPRWLAGKKSAEEEIVLKQTETKKSTTTDSRTYTYIDLFREKDFLFMTLYFTTMYVTLAFFYYEIALEANYFGGSIYITFLCTALADVPGYFMALYLCEKIGRKHSLIGGLFLSGLALALIGVVPATYTHAYAVRVTLAMLSKIFVNLAYNGSFVWVAESYPTVLRAQGHSLCMVFDRIGALCVPLLTSYLYSVNPVLVYIVVGVLGVVMALLGLMQTDTKDLPMYEGYGDAELDT